MAFFSKWPKRVWAYVGIIALLVIAVVGCVHSTSPSSVTIALSSVQESVGMESRLHATVRFLAKDCFPRNRRDTLDKAASYIERELQQYVPVVERQPFIVDGTTFENVSALFPGKSAERIVIGAHYDACGFTPGADDNASGTAGLLELARLLKACSPEYTIELIAYANEEPPYFATGDMGSARHVKRLQEQGIQVKGMICLEMIGYFNDEKGSQNYPGAALKILLPSTGNFIGIVGNTGSFSLARLLQRHMKSYIPTSRVNMPVFNGQGLDFSDHRNFWAADIPAVMLTDTAFFRNKHYHEATDTPDTLDYKRMAACILGLHAAIQEYAGVEESVGSGEKSKTHETEPRKQEVR